MRMDEDAWRAFRHLLESQPYTSSITIGTPGKKGMVKVYFDPDDPTGSERRIREAVRLRSLTNKLMNTETP